MANNVHSMFVAVSSLLGWLQILRKMHDKQDPLQNNISQIRKSWGTRFIEETNKKVKIWTSQNELVDSSWSVRLI